MMRMPAVTMLAKMISNFNFTTFLSMIMEGRERAVTAIMKDRAVPSPTPFKTRASAMGRVPKISAYIGIPTTAAIRTEYHLSCPNTADMTSSGIQLWMAAPMPTPMRI
ncbi:hypothetical protein SDC9_158041 [bioreactor metagenome]|uniref:Uncharacterized protein n=1 Tax=bioreactor metagenome TaxID=1076179 RepID=A0A645FE27_9ZZZZ